MPEIALKQGHWCLDAQIAWREADIQETLAGGHGRRMHGCSAPRQALPRLHDLPNSHPRVAKQGGLPVGLVRLTISSVGAIAASSQQVNYRSKPTG